jgi:PAS domain S-box-containing protein
MESYLKKAFYEWVRKDESVFDFIQEAGPDGIWFWNASNPNDIWINSRFWKTLGYEPSEIPTEKGSWKRNIHPEDWEALTSIHPIQKKIKISYPSTIRCIDKFGGTVSFSIQIKPFRGKKKHEEHILITHRVIDDCKTQLDRTRRAELMLNSSTDILVELTAEGVQKYVSPIVEKYTGYQPHELTRPITEIIHPDDLDRILEHWEEVLEQPDRIHRDTYRHIHKTRGYVWMEATLKSYLDDPNIQSVICSVRDISDRKKAEELLKNSEERYKLLSKTASEMLGLEKLEDIYTYITQTLSKQYPNTVCVFATVNKEQTNTKISNIEGLDQTLLEQVIKISGFNLTGKNFNILPGHYKKYKSGRLIGFEGGLAELAGNEFPAPATQAIEKMLGIHKIYAIGIHKNDKLYAIAHFFTLKNADFANHSYIESFVKQAGIVIERKLMEKRLKESEKRLSLANATKDKFFSIIAHDLRNPFNHLLGFSELNLNYLKEKNYDKVYEAGKMIRESAEEGYALLNNLLEWSQSQQGTFDYRPDYQVLHERVHKAISFLSGMARQKEIQIIRNFDPDIVFYADGNMFDTILRNLVSNAVKYTNRGGFVEIKGQMIQNKLRITVTDDGVGINPKDLKKLFHMEKNHTTNGTRGEKGSGLGLVLCKEFVEKHGGKIQVESKPNKGTTICFTLPNKNGHFIDFRKFNASETPLFKD